MGPVQPTNPLYSGHRMKLGVMAFNCSHGSSITTVDEAWQLSWPETEEIVKMADAARLEALLPVGRWRGYGGPPASAPSPAISAFSPPATRRYSTR